MVLFNIVGLLGPSCVILECSHPVHPVDHVYSNPVRPVDPVKYVLSILSNSVCPVDLL
jgi:hypothetical protein